MSGKSCMPFKKLPFADLLESALARRSLLDVVRDAEDGEVRPDLDRAFFKDLQDWFRAFEPVRFKDPAKHDELVIQILNQLIFAKTMEDYSLVRYRQLQDDWEKAKERWRAKGTHRIVQQFLQDFEIFFEDYYDTELFERSIWDELDLDPKNLDRFARLLEAVLGVDEWSKTFQRGIVHYNYRRIDEDIFGKSYEMFLAANRKDEGIFYTPAGITTPMADSLVNGLFSPLTDQICEAVSAGKADFIQASNLMAELSAITIADTASGSGGFLIKVLRAVWRHYQRVDEACRWVKNWQNGGDILNTPPNVQQAREFRGQWNFENRRVLVAQILLRHVFAVDKDAGAIEVAKTNLWKEAVKLSTDDYNFRNLTGDINRTLPSLRLNFVCADSLVDTDPAKQVAYLAEVCGDAMKKLCALRGQYIANPSNHAPLEDALQLSAKLRENLTEHFQNEPLPAAPIFAALSFFPAWFNADGSARVPRADSGVAPESSLNKQKMEGAAPGATPDAARETRALPKLLAGFDGIIGNPPWEGFKPIRKEFAANFYRGKPQFSKMGMDGPTFEKWFAEELKSNPDFAARWREHEDYYERHKEYFGRVYQKQGTGDWNLFKLFIERDLSLVRPGGQFSLLVPSGFQTDEGCADLRRWFITEHRLDELTSFENRGYKVIENGREITKQIFPDVDSRFKFGFFKVVKGSASVPLAGSGVAPEPSSDKSKMDKRASGATPDAARETRALPTHTFDARFYLHDPKDYSSTPIRYAVEMIHRFSPHNGSFMEFRSPIDYELATKIRSNHRLLEELGYTFRRELHMTGDSHFFRKLGDKKAGKGQLRLYEGKMIHQFDAQFGPATFVVEEAEVREELLRKEIFRLAQFIRDEKLEKLDGKDLPESRDELDAMLRETFKKRGFKLQYEFERFAYREVARSTDERTIIGTIIPKGAVMAHTLMYLAPYEYGLDGKKRLEQKELAEDEAHSLVALANSLILNFYIRSKVSAHVSAFQFLELPAPKFTAAQKKKLADFAGKLLQDPRAVPERAALEVFIARELYGLSLGDWRHLTGTFTFGGGDSKAELDEIIRQSITLW